MRTPLDWAKVGDVYFNVYKDNVQRPARYVVTFVDRNGCYVENSENGATHIITFEPQWGRTGLFGSGRYVMAMKSTPELETEYDVMPLIKEIMEYAVLWKGKLPKKFLLKLLRKDLETILEIFKKTR
jgi:hypothetical protein